MSGAATCFLCGSDQLVRLPYLNMGSLGLVRGLAYRLPLALGRGLSLLSARFARAYRPVETNRRYFDRTLCWCTQCRTGWVEPLFADAELTRYYEEYYWDARDAGEGRHLTGAERPNAMQLSWSEERIAWFAPHVPAFASAIDFGAGDCAASYLLREQATVTAVDPSTKARELAARYGVDWKRSLAECPEVELFYASHSLEHVHDLLEVFAVMLSKVKAGGHLFFEVPNVSSQEVMTKLCHTPHTYALSKDTFERLAQRFDCRIVAIEGVGAPWQVAGQTIRDPSKADLRVLLQKP